MSWEVADESLLRHPCGYPAFNQDAVHLASTISTYETRVKGLEGELARAQHKVDELAAILVACKHEQAANDHDSPSPSARSRNSKRVEARSSTPRSRSTTSINEPQRPQRGFGSADRGLDPVPKKVEEEPARQRKAATPRPPRRLCSDSGTPSRSSLCGMSTPKGGCHTPIPGKGRKGDRTPSFAHGFQRPTYSSRSKQDGSRCSSPTKPEVQCYRDVTGAHDHTVKRTVSTEAQVPPILLHYKNCTKHSERIENHAETNCHASLQSNIGYISSPPQVSQDALGYRYRMSLPSRDSCRSGYWPAQRVQQSSSLSCSIPVASRIHGPLHGEMPDQSMQNSSASRVPCEQARSETAAALLSPRLATYTTMRYAHGATGPGLASQSPPMLVQRQAGSLGHLVHSQKHMHPS